MTNRMLSKLKAVLGGGLLLLTTGMAQALDIANLPLFVPTSMAPNIVVTLDDSGSMRWAFVPDICGSSWIPSFTNSIVDNCPGSLPDSRRYKSSHYNELYYDPATTYPAPVQANGVALSTSFTAARVNGFDSTRGQVNLATGYRPTVTYNPADVDAQGFARHPAGDFADRDTGTAAYYYVFDSTLAGCDVVPANQKDDDDCYRKVAVTSAEEQNFANWYSFYRTRNLATVSAASRGFDKVSENVRVAWQALSTCNSLTSGSCANWENISYNNKINTFSGSHRNNFYSWVHKLPATGNTFLRLALKRAGEYFKTSGENSPYDNKLGDASDNSEYACRPNFHVMLTDGMWNDSDSDVSLAIGNYDNNTQTLGDGTTYTARAPYSDGNSLSLADIALHYWASDLRGTLDNLVIPYTADYAGDAAAVKWNPKNDPATWQHMVNYMVGLGLGGSLKASGLTWGGDTYSGSYANLLAGTTAWPATGGGLTGNVADLWHASLNSRGQFYSADKPDDLNKAFESILNSIQANSSRASAPAQSSSRLDTETVIYQAGFNTLDWTGTLMAFRVNSTTGVVDANPLWEASALLPAHGDRRIYTWKPSVGGVEFLLDNLSADQQAALGNLNTLVNYLRGDGSNEGTWRRRGSKLGDIINSDPLYVAAADYGYEALPGGASSGATTYRDYVINTKRGRTRMLYVGANDGMLHGFDAGKCVSFATDGSTCLGFSSGAGREKMAFIPNEAIVNQGLATLKDASYSHRYFVDGSPFAGDAYLNSGWKTVLVGGMGAGGRAVFALDITTPDSFAAGNVLWEFTHANLGYTFGQPIIVRLNNGRWAAVFGNGYPDDAAAATATAKLFIVYLDADASDGWLADTDYVVIDTNTQTANGLSTPVGYDGNQDRVTDTIYAGDLQGNLWKFDLSSADPANWTVSYDDGGSPAVKKPLFSARNASGQVQPITAPLELGRAPSGQPSGLMVYFGTGRFLATGDNVVAGAQTQTFYGIYDSGSRIVTPTTTDVNGNTVPDRGAILQSQTVLGATTASGFDVRVTSDNPVDYASKRGWFMDLPATGERVVSTPLLRHGRVVFVTLIPSADPCSFGGDSWLMEVNAENGDRPDSSVLDISGDSEFTIADYVTYGGLSVPLSGVKSPVGIIDTPAVVTTDTSEIKIGFGAREDAAGKTSFSIGEAPGQGRSGRVSWREIID